jgi:hypothetical protein
LRLLVVFVPRTSSTPVATWFWQTEGRSAERVILGVRPSEFILSEFQSPSRRIFIGSHSLPPPSGRLIGPSSWAHSYKGCRRASSRHPRIVESRPIPTEELCRQEEARSKLQSWRFRLPQGFTYPRDSEISGARKVGPSVHWTV